VHRHRPAGVLSGEEQQRVAIVRALVNDPPLLLCDEPTVNLDRATGAQVMDLHTLASQAPRKTLVVVPHDAEIARRFPAQLRLRDGRLQGDPDDDAQTANRSP
jgi:putative ABC transport system ATP-binding protein